MCLWIASEKFVAEEDIVVYKYLIENEETGALYPPFASRRWYCDPSYHYILGERKEEILDEPYANSRIMERGLHSFVKPFSGETDKEFRDSYKFSLFRCVIPKGAEYHRGFWDDRVTECVISSALIVQEKI